MIRIEIASANSLMLAFSYQASADIQQQITSVAHEIAQLEEVTDLVPAPISLLVCFDLLKTDSAQLIAKLEALLQSKAQGSSHPGSSSEQKTKMVSYDPLPPLFTESRGLTSEAKRQIQQAHDSWSEQAPQSGFSVIHPGLMSQIQDGGRRGYQQQGLTSGGPLDEHAFQWANHLLQNTSSSPVIEISFGGLKLQSQVDTLIAVTGADLSLSINDQPAPNWEILAVRAGDRIEFGYPKSGTRAYLAVKGGFQLPQYFGSSATVQWQGLGGFGDQHSGDSPCTGLQFGELLPCNEQEHRSNNQLQSLIGKRVSSSYIPDYQHSLSLRVVLGYQRKLFSADQLERFFRHSYQISQDCDRKAFVLEGSSIKPQQSQSTEQGLALGAVQISDQGQPVIAMPDRQLLSKCSILGCIYPPDLGQLAQRHPKTEVRFEPISLYEAQLQLTRLYRYFR
ncbi:carboxyltransferase domain-containing protein [Oceanospirillum beijerinckii]|uniref:carboxyltransferase domain-containing protein n=1 Tax=Oceanospirillum beijerinckii TaxID=64976 RepID=UPI000418E9C9|nr:carboxyltransferase domain-containing protein [Oceanospirillum beijerinckii]